MTHRPPEQIKQKFEQLRETCDPRGHELLDELERFSLADNAMLALHDRIAEVTNEIAGIPLDTRPPDNVVALPDWKRRNLLSAQTATNHENGSAL